MKKMLAAAALACGLAVQGLFVPAVASAAPVSPPHSSTIAPSDVIVIIIVIDNGDGTGTVIIIVGRTAQ